MNVLQFLKKVAFKNPTPHVYQFISYDDNMEILD